MKKNRITVLVIIFLLALGVGWFYYFRILAVNYLIPGVPYNGTYNLYFQQADTSEISSILDIFGYWGDKRFSVADLRQEFPPARFTASTTSTSVTPAALKSEIINFFTENGYETSGWISSGPDSAIKKIKQFVNSKKNIPVIVLPKRFLDEENNIFLFMPQVVIGVFDDSRKVIVHDHYHGNNYEISYADFEKTFQSGRTVILAVWPSDKIKGLIEGPNYNFVYPQRLESMNKAGALLATKNLLALRFWQMDNFEQSAAIFQEFVSDPNFESLPPVFRVQTISKFAAARIYLKQFDEAIRIIKEDVLPINQNLSEAAKGWVVPPIDKAAYPYFVLSVAYLKKGEKNLAISSYKKMKSISASFREKVEAGLFTEPPQIEKLEKEISKKK